MKKFKLDWMNEKPADEHEWSTGYKEGLYLYNLARSLSPDIIVEIGTFRGYSGAYFLQALEDQNKGILYTVDVLSYNKFSEEELEENHQIAMENLRSVGSRFISVIRSPKEARWNTDPIDLLYIDGDHSYEACLRDLEIYELWVRKYGIILIHDYHGIRVKKAVTDYFKDKNGYAFSLLPEESYKNNLMVIIKK
jgi:predicted O-methyltransferase YrrM